MTSRERMAQAVAEHLLNKGHFFYLRDPMTKNIVGCVASRRDGGTITAALSVCHAKLDSFDKLKAQFIAVERLKNSHGKMVYQTDDSPHVTQRIMGIIAGDRWPKTSFLDRLVQSLDRMAGYDDRTSEHEFHGVPRRVREAAAAWKPRASLQKMGEQALQQTKDAELADIPQAEEQA